MEEKLKEIQSEETADNKYYVFHYDCWKYDYYEEPIIAIISAMIDEIENEPRFFSEEIQNVGKLAGKTVKDVLKAIMGELAQNKIGIDLVELATGILMRKRNKIKILIPYMALEKLLIQQEEASLKLQIIKQLL